MWSALEEFGPRDSHFEEDGEIISKATIERFLIFSLILAFNCIVAVLKMAFA